VNTIVLIAIAIIGTWLCANVLAALLLERNRGGRS
jgi:hypothetical protein